MDRRLTRSRDAMIGGVAAGVATWMNADPAIIRIAWALLVPLTGGIAFLAYIVAWIVIPEEPRPIDASPTVGADGEAASDAPPPPIGSGGGVSGDRAALLIGGGLIVLGLWFLVREYLPEIRWDLIWPLLLVGAGAVILVTASRRR